MFRHMLQYELQAHCSYDKNNEIKFSPPVYEQRYTIVAKVLEDNVWDGKIRKVVEFGCAEMRFLQILKRIKGVEHILQVDIDKTVLEENMYKATPLISDHLNPRATPLRIDIYKGNLANFDDCLKETDAVVGIEVVEHLYPDDLENLPYNIFGCISPKVVLLTTPNSEFNVLFHLNTANGFRHPDHKFEWSRKEFKDWCENICLRYPKYEVHYLGIGRGPPDERSYGHVSQLGIFVRKDFKSNQVDKMVQRNVAKMSNNTSYTLLNSIEFPYLCDNRSYTAKILDEVKYHLNRFQYMRDRYFNNDENVFEIPLEDLLYFIPTIFEKDNLKEILVENGYIIKENDKLLMAEEDYTESDGTDSDENVCEHSKIETAESVEETWD